MDDIYHQIRNTIATKLLSVLMAAHMNLAVFVGQLDHTSLFKRIFRDVFGISIRK